MKTVYFVRHGESAANAGTLHSSGDTPLTKIGKKQARAIAARFRHLPVDVIFASDYHRALDTAREIQRRVKKRLVVSKFLREISRPSELTGRSRAHPEVIRIQKLLEGKTAKRWHYSDEENFHDFKTRVSKFLRTLERRKEKHILVVSHAGTMLMLLGLMVAGMDFEQKMFYRFFEVLLMKNTGLTVSRYKDKSWKIVVWNDHAHLGE